VKYGATEAALQSLAVRRPLVLALATALLTLGLLAGCGGDDDGGNGGGDDVAEVKERFDTAYRPINDEFLALGRETGEAITTARRKSNASLATRFESLSTRVTALRGRLDALEPPPEYESDAERVSNAMAVVAGDLNEIAQAAQAGDASEARAQVQELARHSVEVRTARRALARKTGAKV
jgi:hypothetical protein